MVGSHVNIHVIQYIMVAASTAFLLSIVQLIRSNRLKEAYGLLWLLVALAFVVFSVWRDGVHVVARLMGVVYAPAALFLVLLAGVMAILIQLSIVVSQLRDQGVRLAQTVGLLRLQIEQLHRGQGAADPGPAVGGSGEAGAT